VGRLFRLVGFAVIVVAAMYGALTFARQNQTCVVALAGHAVSVEVKGPSADAQCQSFQGVTAADGSGWYVVQGGVQPGGALVCQAGYDGDIFTVRDQGVTTALGLEVCQRLAKLSGG
jgi:hypothetical protein